MSKIPKIIHFIWVDFKNELNDNPIIPTKYLDNIKNTQLLNLDYKIKIWSGYKCDQFIKKYFPNKYKLYWDFKYPIQRCDYIRFIILYVYGGIYSDMDRYSVKSYNNILDKYNNSDVILGKIGYNIINNDIIFSKPLDDFILKCINNITIYNFNYFFIDVCATTGPIFLMKLYYTYDGPSKITIITTEVNPCDLCNCNHKNMNNIISFTTLDNTWIDKTINYSLLSTFFCNFYSILVGFIIIFLLIIIYKKCKK